MDGDEEAKRFDLLVLRTQLSILQAAPGFSVLRDQIRAIASALEEQAAVPAIHAELVLIQAIAGDDWWNDVTLGMLENARKRLRLLVKLIQKAVEDKFGLGFFIRCLVGMEREAVAQAFSEVIVGTQARPDQIEFIELIASELTINGVREAKRLYESPLLEVDPRRRNLSPVRRHAGPGQASMQPRSGWSGRRIRPPRQQLARHRLIPRRHPQQRCIPLWPSDQLQPRRPAPVGMEARR